MSAHHGQSWPGARWRKSTRSSDPSIAACIEVAPLTSVAAIAVRDSKDVSGPALVFGSAVWGAFVAAVKADTYPVA